MKKHLINLCIIINAVFIYSCDTHHHEMYTRINADGSCYREFIENTDSAFFSGDTTKNPFPMKLDTGWKITRFKKTPGDSVWLKKHPARQQYKQTNSTYSFYAIAGKEFPAVEDLAESFRFNNNSNWDSIVPTLSYQKSFRWFYTYYEFSETYQAVNPWNLMPIHNYLSDMEIDTWFGENTGMYKGNTGEEVRDMLNNLENKVNDWLIRSYYEQVFRQYLAHYRYFKNMPVDSSAFSREKDRIFKFFKNSLDKNSDSMAYFDDNYSKGFDEYFHTHAFTKNITQEMDDRMAAEIPDFTKYFNMDLTYNLSMPGKILETNAPFKYGDTLSWKVDAKRFFIKEYKLTAASRKTNSWAFGVTAVIVLLSVLGLWVKRKPG